MVFVKTKYTTEKFHLPPRPVISKKQPDDIRLPKSYATEKSHSDEDLLPLRLCSG